MGELYGKNFVMNGALLPAEKFSEGLIYEGESVYEVLRMKDGIPLFFREHLRRLERSALLSDMKFGVNEALIRRDIELLVAGDPKPEANLKIILNLNGKKATGILYYTMPAYPTQETYTKGVKGITFNAARVNPGVKIVNPQMRRDINEALERESAYEALLVNEEGFITEGSRSNIFFVMGERLVTAPDSFVLKGVTRDHLLDICREEAIEVEFRCVRVNEISSFDAAFMSGTSPVVLPFNSVDMIRFSPGNRLVKTLYSRMLTKMEISLREYYQ